MLNNSNVFNPKTPGCHFPHDTTAVYRAVPVDAEVMNFDIALPSTWSKQPVFESP
jgi:hypothetical protein